MHKGRRLLTGGAQPMPPVMKSATGGREGGLSGGQEIGSSSEYVWR